MDHVCLSAYIRDRCIDKPGTGSHPEDYLASVGKKEAAQTTAFGQARHRQFYHCFSEETIQPEDHLSLLSQYEHVVRYIVPKQEGLASPALRHPDLHPENIFVCPNSTKILAIIDWQGTSVLPFFIQAGVPALCDENPVRSQPLGTPKLPDNYDTMNPKEKEEAFIELRHNQANRFYIAATAMKCEVHLRALQTRYLGTRQYLIKQAGKPWNGDLVNLRAALIGIYSKWHDLVGEDPCPISFTAEEIQSAMKESEEWNDAAADLRNIRNYIGIDGQGGIDPEHFDFAKALNKEFRLQILREVDPEEKERFWQIWPFKDDDDNSEVPTVIQTVL